MIPPAWTICKGEPEFIRAFRARGDIRAWLSRPDVARMMGEIAQVAERYPGLRVSDTFALGEAARRVLPALLGYILLTLTFPWGGMWIERIHTRRLASLQEWGHNPKAYVQRAIREGEVRLPAPSLCANMNETTLLRKLV